MILDMWEITLWLSGSFILDSLKFNIEIKGSNFLRKKPLYLFILSLTESVELKII